MEAQKDMLSVAEAAEILGITPSGVRDRIRRGLLPAVRVGRKWRIAAADLMIAEGVSPGLARYLCQFLASSLAEKIPEIYERDALKFTMARLNESRERERELLREVGRLEGQLEAAQAEAARLGQDITALASEVRLGGGRTVDYPHQTRT